MPHLIVEYSTNLESVVDIQELINTLHDAVVADGVSGIGAVRTRAARRENFKIADGDPTHALVALTLRLGPGRDAATKLRVLTCVLDTAEDVLRPIYDQRTVALSAEIQEIDADFRINRNHVKRKVDDEAAAT